MRLDFFQALHVDVQALDRVSHILVENVEECADAAGRNFTSHLLQLDLGLLDVESQSVALFADIGSLFFVLGLEVYSVAGGLHALELGLEELVKLLVAHHIIEVVLVRTTADVIGAADCHPDIMEVLHITSTFSEQLLKLGLRWHDVFLKEKTSDAVHKVHLGLHPVY